MFHDYNELIIDLDSIKHNYQLLSSLIAPSRCRVVLKSDAYGFGLEKIASHLTECRDFFVAYMDEALDLRSVVPKDVRVFMLNGPYGVGWPFFCRQHCIIPVVNEMNTLDMAINERIEYALHVDTGLNRLGLLYQECLVHLDKIQKHPPSYLMSHLTSSEEKENEHNRIQLQRFREIASFFPGAEKSLSNSGGIFLGKDYHFDIVRSGIAVYGIWPYGGEEGLRFPLTLRACILQIYSVTNDQTVRYNQTFKAPKPMQLATVAIGYGDGLPWRSGLLATTHHLREKQPLVGGHWNNEFVPIVGRISMDLVSVDITNVVGKKPEVGDFITFLSPSCNLDVWTSLVQQSHYELPLRMGKRLRRVYVCQETQVTTRTSLTRAKARISFY